MIDEESDWDPFNPAKFQVGRQWVNQAERIQQLRQAKRYRKVEYPTKKKSISLRNKKCCLGGTQSKTDTHQKNLNYFDCGSICRVHPGVVCTCGLFMCYKYLEKIKVFLTDHNCRIPLYLMTVFCAMEEGTNTVETYHGCFLRRPSQEKRAFTFRKLAYRGPKSPHPPYHGHLIFKEFGLMVDSAYHGPKCPDPPYHGHLKFKEFGLMVDSNSIDIVGKTLVDVHGLGAEKGDEPLIVSEKVKCNGTKAPLHMVIDLETAEYLDCGVSLVFATKINGCFSYTQCKPHLQGRFKCYLKGLKLSNYVPEMVLKKGYA
eukprot:CAMPEP_0201252128 /NCGR_PEP_ID=MMETSP0852-20130820/66745_1 /ASSEMBLY_ACC=CAM_ASM_000632 /TAXON_ID=183588 /ORGANISM="Pseudo-nitzschia fraudulenta, Strain WWA7" /LENGTH=314 /DNA_ID=CAMNT_0047551813 /DNA_START=1078 /DNA_END=2020 /DNA_ORIENTATION=-